MADRIIHCIKFDKDLPGLDKPPFSGPVGQEIYDKVSREAWLLWKEEVQIRVLNEYRLNMGDPRDYQTLVGHMLGFLNLKKD